MSTTATFQADAGIAVAGRAIDERLDVVIETARDQAEAARVLARNYAEHLAAGGDPTSAPGDTQWDRDKLVAGSVGLAAVARVWNRARGSSNSVMPFRNAKNWRMAEVLFEHYGEPVLFADLQEAGRSTYKATGNDVADLVLTIERMSDGVTVGRKTRVEKKRAYLIRDRREGDPAPGAYHEVPEE